MNHDKPARGSNTWAFLALTGLGALGALTLILTAEATLSNLPEDQITAAGGMGAVKAALLLQPIILVMAASAVGLALAHKVGLSSDIVARVRGQGDRSLRLWTPILAGAATGALILGGDMLFAWARPDAFSSLQAAEADPFIALIQGALYGGLTEEILLRWGLLSLIAWLLVKLRLEVTPAKWVAVILAALIFAAGHLPALALVADPSMLLIVRTLLLNAIGGLAFGALFVRYNLEAAMVAHMATHLIFFIARLTGAA